MPRDSNGNYSLPAGNPVVTGEVISSAWANTTLDDVATAVTDSLSRSGEGGMLAALELYDGTIGAPGMSWSSETTSGLYRASAGNFRFAIGGVDIFTITSAGLSIADLTVTGAISAGRFIPTGSTVPANGLYLPSANTVGIASNSTLRWSVNSTGNHIINAPSTGAALGVTGLVGVNADISVSRSSSTANSIALGPNIILVDSGGGTQGCWQHSGGQTELWQFNGSWTQILKVLSTRGITINSPSSGATVTASNSDNAVSLNALATSGQIKLHGYHSSFSGGFIQVRNAGDSAYIPLNLSATSFTFSASTGTFTIASDGSIAVGAGLASLVASTTPSQNYISFGDSASGANAYVGWAGSTGNIVNGLTRGGIGIRTNTAPIYFSTDNGGSATVAIGSSGGMTVGSPTGGNMGAATINATDIYVAGAPVAYRNLSSRVFTGNDSTAASDNGKCVTYAGSGGHTFNCDSDLPTDGVVVIKNQGSGNLTIAGSGFTLFWMNGSGSISSGSRTLVSGGICTIHFNAGVQYEVWGIGLS